MENFNISSYIVDLYFFLINALYTIAVMFIKKIYLSLDDLTNGRSDKYLTAFYFLHSGRNASYIRYIILIIHNQMVRWYCIDIYIYIYIRVSQRKYC